MITISISLLFGFAAFAALLTTGVSTVRGIMRGQQIMAELAELDSCAGHTSSRGMAISRSGPARQVPFSPARQRYCVPA